MIALIRSPSRTYLDPWTGQLFGEGGLEGNLHPKLDPNARIGGVEGGVIMSKLGNETAKCVEITALSLNVLLLISTEGQHLAVLHGNYCKFHSFQMKR